MNGSENWLAYEMPNRDKSGRTTYAADACGTWKYYIGGPVAMIADGNYECLCEERTNHQRDTSTAGIWVRIQL